MIIGDVEETKRLLFYGEISFSLATSISPFGYLLAV